MYDDVMLYKFIQLVALVSEPGFRCREHTLTRSKDHPLEKIDTIYARPILEDDIAAGRKSYTLWTWSRQDAGRNFSIIDVRKGVFNIPKKLSPGGRVYSMTATGEVEKRIWIGTAVSHHDTHHTPAVMSFKLRDFTAYHFPHTTQHMLTHTHVLSLVVLTVCPEH